MYENVIILFSIHTSKCTQNITDDYCSINFCLTKNTKIILQNLHLPRNQHELVFANNKKFPSVTLLFANVFFFF